LSGTIQEYVKEKNLLNLNVLVLKDGKIIYQHSFGHADIENRIILKKDMIYRIMSTTKLVTALAIMILYDERHLTLSDPVFSFIPEFKNLQVHNKEDNSLKNLKRDITIVDLLTHTSGLTYGFWPDSPVDKQYFEAKIFDHTSNLETFVHKIVKFPLVHQPGEIWRYSVSFDVLARIVEIITGQNYRNFIKTRIFDPLEMDDTDYIIAMEKRNRFLPLYQKNSDGLKKLVSTETTFIPDIHDDSVKLFAGGHGLLATTEDVGKLLQLFLNKGVYGGQKLLEKETIDLIWRNHLPRDLLPFGFPDNPKLFEGYNFGLGFPIVVTPKEIPYTSFPNELYWGGGLNTDFWINPNNKVIVLSMSQFQPRDFSVAHTVKNLVYELIN
jgi:CubicO group peptidase (beta-lactamase class C family)